jgi:SAM-dependent methyltransferase
MNSEHAAFCSSQEWAEAIRVHVIPGVVGALELGEDVLEIGPGYGPTTAELRQLTPKLTAIEIDEQLADRLAGLYPDVTVVRGNAAELPFEDERFSAAVCFTMLHHVATVDLQDQIFAETHRVLRPGGVFAGSDSTASDDLREFHHDDIYNPIDPTGLADRLRRAGFADPEVTVDEDHFRFQARA